MHAKPSVPDNNSFRPGRRASPVLEVPSSKHAVQKGNARRRSNTDQFGQHERRSRIASTARSDRESNQRKRNTQIFESIDSAERREQTSQICPAI